ncbi:hypothetical protein TCAL_15852 [Tigriopus californicus]|uniref:Cuticle protein n=1 Tax=Tigriopus californicus TaxID=6832 RepID=A0A553NQY4_TIGCA|nr:uncharacterized protein LOC131879100 [Tigriopus californicus]TRY67845.1 hypothetical protein TCAL_15852 [Tigriopus californicus]
MKTIVLLLAVAFVKAEPQFLYNSPLAYTSQYAPLAYTTYAASPLMKAMDPKAEKDMKVEMEPKQKIEYQYQPYASVAAPWAYKMPLTTAYQTYASAALPLAYNVPLAPKYQAKNGDVEHTVYKREAEAEADAQFLYNGYYPYTTYAAAPAATWAATPAWAAYSPYYAAPVVANKYVVPAAKAIDVKDKVYANDAMSAWQYAAKGQYVADSAGAVHIAKREAEADPALIYGYGYTPYASTYATNYAYAPYAAYPYSAINPYTVAAPYYYKY